MKDIRSFLGHAGFYLRFIKNFNKIYKPLSSLQATGLPFHFSKECEMAFAKLKKALFTAPILHPPIWGEPFELICDAPDYAVRAVLGQ